MTELETETRKTAHEILSTFEPRIYSAPWWARNKHVNTIVGALFAVPLIPSYRRERWSTDDGDFIDVDFLQAEHQPSRGIVILCHGLESTTYGPLTVRQALALSESGFDVAAIAFRGCSGEDNRTPGAYHLGFTSDVRMVAARLHKADPARRIFLTATSLGGNVMIKLLGELGDDAASLGICGAAVACVPMNALECQWVIDGSAFNRRVYSANFLKSLRPKAERQNQRFPGVFDIEGIRRATTIGEFDDAFIAPIYGFRNKEDYYTQCGSKAFLSRVRVPCLVVNALDDPFFHAPSLPTPEDAAPGTVRLVYTRHGGHCGFLEGLRSLSVDFRALLFKLFLGRRIAASGRAPNGWLPQELARFLVHVDDELSRAPATKR